MPVAPEADVEGDCVDPTQLPDMLPCRSRRETAAYLHPLVTVAGYDTCANLCYSHMVWTYL